MESTAQYWRSLWLELERVPHALDFDSAITTCGCPALRGVCEGRVPNRQRRMIRISCASLRDGEESSRARAEGKNGSRRQQEQLIKGGVMCAVHAMQACSETGIFQPLGGFVGVPSLE